MAMRYLEFRKGTSHKFWKINQSGKSITVTFGRIGTGGQSKTRKFDTPTKAKAAAEKLIAEKLKKGYLDAGSGSKSKCSPAETKHIAAPGKKIPSEIKFRSKSSLGSDSVKKSWRRLEKWFKKYLPETFKTLNPPASRHDLGVLEKTLKQDLPKSLRESFLCHNGNADRSPGVIFGLYLLPIDATVEILKMYQRYERTKATKYNFDEYASCFPLDWVQPVDSSAHWIPLTSDSGGNQIVVDMAPGPKGTKGQVVICGRDDEFHPVLAYDWGQFLADIATELERGNFMIIQHERTKFTGRPEFVIGSPRTHHFHDVGVEWSRRKLGLRTLSAKDQAVWKKQKKNVDAIAAKWTHDF